MQTGDLKLNTRHKEILALAKQQGFLSTEELARDFGVTTQTIRRDINMLCENGLLRRFHGGAGPASSTENVDYSSRQVLNHAAKIGIAQSVVENVPDNSSLFINIGTTTEEVAKALVGRKNLRVITNNLNVAAQLCGNENCEVIIAGGVVRRDGGIIGESTIDFIRQFKVDFGIIGISGIDGDGTLLDFDYREVRVAQAIIENSRQAFLVADHTKFSITPMVKLGNLADIDVLFTDATPPQDILDVLAQAKTRLVIAGG
jgi:DeoR family transcriptional regulator, glycerol-3-phosphate regulon repressor